MPHDDRPTLFCLHALGSSAREFDALRELLADDFDVVGIDLPGFGEASAATGTSVDEMVGHVVRKIRRHGSTRFVFVGHSMGGKIASLVAARTLDGSSGLFGLAGVVLLAGSPPSPEPMGDDARAQMLSWARAGIAGDGHLATANARTFIDDNVGAPLSPENDDRALSDVLRSAAEAWLAWFERGSLEDRAAEVGILDVPALIVAGGSDGPLGEAGQREHNLPVYPRATLEVLAGAGHLLPLERPDELADLIRVFWRERVGSGPFVSPGFGRVIGSGRTSSQTRAILAGRALPDDPDYAPQVLDAAQLATLRLVAERVVPQGPAPFDIAGRVDAGLARGVSDGWRNAALPPDQEAYRLGLDALDDFATLDDEAKDSRIQAIVDQQYAPRAGTLTAEQMTLWFEDCRVDLTRTWLAHPATMERIGFDGFANGGDVIRIQGFTELSADRREAWEPAMPGPSARDTGASTTQTTDTGITDTDTGITDTEKETVR